MNLVLKQDSGVLINVDANIVHIDKLINDSVQDSSFVQDTLFIDSTIIHNLQTEVVPPNVINSLSVNENKFIAQERNFTNHDWITIHLLICIGLLAWVQVYFLKRVKQILKSFTGIRYLNQLSRDGNIFRERVAIPLLIIYLITFSLLLYLFTTDIMKITIFELKGVKLYSLIIVMVLLLWIVKNVAVVIVGNIFKNHIVLSEYLLTNFVFNLTLGMILLPIGILAVYMQSVETIYIGLIVWVLVNIYRIAREFFIELSYTKFSWVYRILYLCTLEIIPLIVFTKLVVSYLT